MIRTLLFLAWLCPAAVHATPPGAAAAQQEPKPAPIDEIDKLRAQLRQPGPDGKAARETAIERLLSLTDERAHALLRAQLALASDPDGVRPAVLQALSRRLRNPADPVLGIGEARQELRDKLLRGYAGALATFWHGEPDPDGLLPADPLRELARACLVSMPAGLLEQGLRAVAAAGESPLPLRVAALRAASDGQNLHLGRLPADYLEAAEPELQAAARSSLRTLTFTDKPFLSKSQYEAWHRLHGDRTYLELAEEAGRSVASRSRQQQEALSQVRRTAAAEYVAAATDRRGGVNWTEVQSRTLVEEPGTMLACLEELRRTMAEATLDDKNARPRLAFGRELLERAKGDRTADPALRAAMLEVAAYLCRPGEAELAGELSAELVLQLQSEVPGLRLAALRGLRRLPTPEARSAVVELGSQAVGGSTEAHAALLAQVLQTLSWKGEMPWRAPIEGAADKQEWLALLRAVVLGSFGKERCREALAVGLLLDRENKRVPEVFDLLVDLARDGTKEPELRTNSLIHLQDWRDQGPRADVLVGLLTDLLADNDRDVRLFAANSLARLPEASEERKHAWVNSIVGALRGRLLTEMNPSVLQAMVNCLVACGRESGQLEGVIGAVNSALDSIELPVPQEQEFRVNMLLTVLPEIAADTRATPGQWIGACEMLYRHNKRAGLRHVLNSHNAVELGNGLRSADQALAEQARRALRFVLLAGVMKPPAEPWQPAEAEDLRLAFEKLQPGDRLPENIENPPFRLLRLDLLLTGGRTKDVMALAAQYLGEQVTSEHQPFDPLQQDSVRLLAAEACLVENKLEQAADYLSRLDAARAQQPKALDLGDRLGRAYLPTDATRASLWLEKVVSATREDDPAFRHRFVAMLEARMRAEPARRAEVIELLDRKAAMFDAPDCPEELKAKVAQLRDSRSG